jgi:hypothetical protein
MQQAELQIKQQEVQMKAQKVQGDLAIKQQELQLKAQKQQIDAAAKADQLEIEKSRIEAQKEIAAMQVSATAAAARDKLNKSMELEGTRIGVEAAKHKAQMQQQRAQSHQNRMAQNRVPRDKKE